VVASDVESENAKDWGFCDAVFKSGKLLFPSILKLRAARRMEKIFEAAGEFSKTEAFRRDAGRVLRGLGIVKGAGKSGKENGHEYPVKRRGHESLLP